MTQDDLDKLKQNYIVGNTNSYCYTPSTGEFSGYTAPGKEIANGYDAGFKKALELVFKTIPEEEWCLYAHSQLDFEFGQLV